MSVPGATVYAVLRCHLFLGADAPVEETVTVKCVLPTADDAKREVARLNDVVDGNDVQYSFQATRLISGDAPNDPRGR